LSRFVALLLMAGVAVPAPVKAAAAQTASDQTNREPIIVTAPLFRDIQPERQLDQDAIESYGVSTIDELLGEVQVELGEESEEPLIIVNGQRMNDLSEIGAFPVEILNNVQVLPRGSAVALGGRPGQRVISLNLKRQVTTETLTVAHKLATDGDWDADRGEALVTRVKGNARLNIALRVRDESSLLESDRGIIQPAPRLPYALSGNVIGFPNTSGEIDPALSALAGQVVTVTPIPGTATPTLADFVANANQPAVTGLGQFRTLKPDVRNYDLNGTFATPVTNWLTANLTLRGNRNTSNAKRGLPTGLFIVSGDNAFSPFTDDVALAFYGPHALQSRSFRTSAEGNLTLNAVFGRWNATWNNDYLRLNSVTDSQRPSTASVRIDDDVNPFATDLVSLITFGTSRFSTRTVTTTSDLTANGPVVDLPAGPLIATIEGKLAWNRLNSNSVFAGIANPRNFRRSEQSIRGAVDIPLTSRDGSFLSALGDLDLNVEYGHSHFSDAGGINHHAFEFNWQPHPAVQLVGSIESTENPAPIETLGGAITVNPDTRIFDPLTGETVDVTLITGGNPGLLPQETRIRRLSSIFRLVPRLNLQLNAEYTDTDRRNFVSGLPEASAAVALAFPDRYIRDPNGVLTIVDLRPVNFESDREKRLRWGFSMNAKIGGSKAIASALLKPGAKRTPAPRPTYLQLTANHTVVFSEEIRIRPGLEPVDVLHGGAIGIGGGRLRHQIDATAALNSGGTGIRVGVTWRGKSELESRISGIEDTLRFSPVFLVNARAFTDLKRFLPESKWAKGLRLSLEVVNLFNDRQDVRDSFGNTPLQYQPAYRDPIGRTVEFEIRKVF
jgi:hypothetical protein